MPFVNTPFFPSQLEATKRRGDSAVAALAAPAATTATTNCI